MGTHIASEQLQDRGVIVMRRQDFGWLMVGAGTGLGLFMLNASIGLVFFQALVSAHVGIAGKLDSPVGERVTVSVAPAAGYGLTASERREGQDALNQPQEAQVVLSDSPFRVVLPRVVRYCTHYPVWRHPPPPPMRFTLRFSDSPDEEYIIFRSRKKATYVVLDSNGLEVSQEQARWRLSLGDLEPIDPVAHLSGRGYCPWIRSCPSHGHDSANGEPVKNSILKKWAAARPHGPPGCPQPCAHPAMPDSASARHQE